MQFTWLTSHVTTRFAPYGNDIAVTVGGSAHPSRCLRFPAVKPQEETTPVDTPLRNSTAVEIFVQHLSQTYGHSYKLEGASRNGDRVIVRLECQCGAFLAYRVGTEMVALCGPADCLPVPQQEAS